MSSQSENSKHQISVFLLADFFYKSVFLEYLDKYQYKRISPGEIYEKWLTLSLTLKG